MFESWIGKKISLLFEGKNQHIEQYSGILEDVKEGFLILNPDNPNLFHGNFIIEKIIIKEDSVLSVWIYKK